MTTIYELGRAKLTELHQELTEGQINIFNRMYGSIQEIADDRINWAIQQCERSIARNKGVV